MTLGKRIRKFRIDGGMTQRELADEIGLTESAIRNYERDIRTPKDDQIVKIAKALDVSPDSIREIGITSARGALEVVFRYENQLGLIPIVTEDGIAISCDHTKPESIKTEQALNAWKHMRDELAAGNITQDEYREWKAHFNE